MPLRGSKNSSVPSPPPRRRRRRWIFLAGLLAAAALIVGLFSAPPVQGWLLRRAIATQPGWRIDFSRFGASPTGVEITGADFGLPGLDAHAEPLALLLAPGRLFTRREIAVERIDAHKLRLVITPAKFAPSAASASPPAPAPPSAPFAGVLALLRSPLPWALDAANLDGEIAVRDGDTSLVVGTFAVNGGGLSSGHTGEFTYDLLVNSALLPPGPENKVHNHGTLRLTQTDDHGVGRIDVAGELDLPNYHGLSLPPARYTVALAASPDGGEDYRAHLDFGPGTATALDFTGHLDAKNSRLAGHLALHADQSLVLSLLGARTPTATLSAGADLALDLRSGDLDVSFTGDLDARDAAKFLPELAVVDALKAHLTSVLASRAGQFSLEKFHAALHGETSPLALTCELTKPFALKNLSTSFVAGPLATVTLEHAPLAWANPWLAPAGLQLSPAEFSGAWILSRSPATDASWIIDTTQPCATTPLTLSGASVPLIPPARFEFNPKFTVSTDHASVDIAKFAIVSDQNDKISAHLVADYDFATRTLHSAGRLRGGLPTLLSDNGQPLPFSLVAQWDFTLAGSRLAAKEFEFTARKRAIADPFLSLKLLQPLALDLQRLRVVDATAGDWLRLKFAGLQLGFVSHWLPGHAIAGSLAEGESILRSAADGKLTLESVTPWRIADASFAIGGRTLFAGELGAKPGFSLDTDRATADLAGLVARDRDGNRVTGAIALTLDRKTQRATSTIDVEADLPKLPHSAETFGPLSASLHAKSHNETKTIAAMDAFALRVSNAQRELLTAEASQPFLFGLSDTGMVTVATLAPLRLALDELPLAWLRPWITNFEFEGTLQPCEFLLTASMTKFALRPTKPVQVRQFAARTRSRELARDTQLTLYPALDLTFICVPLPKFTLAYSGSGYLTDVALEVAGQRAMDFDAACSFVGDDKKILPSSLELTTRLDFAPLAQLPAAVAGGLPPRGTLVARIDGDLLGKNPLECWARLEGVPSADGARTLPALELSARGNVALAENAFRSRVELRYDTKPVATDARFGGKFDLSGENLEISSGFRSQFFDAGEMLALVEAFLPKNKSTITPSDVGGVTPPRNLAPALAPHTQPGPLWAGLRGHFNLEMAAVQFSPYRIDALHGRLDLRERELVLSALSGAMFAGRFDGNVRIDYQPADAGPDHTLAADFKIEQFDSARVVQTAFPNQVASLDARIDVHSTLHSSGRALPELIDRAEGSFTVEGKEGVMHLHVPQQDTLATAAVFGGTMLLSPELRALGRLLKNLAEMPVDRLVISGQRTAAGDVALDEFRLDSPQARFLARGKIPAVAGEPLMRRPLELSVDLGAKDEMAVILGGMSLIEKKPRADGFRPLKEKFVIGGRAGEPDTQPFYDLLAKAVVGSKGTWGFLMRKMQAQVEKPKTPPPKKSAALNR